MRIAAVGDNCIDDYFGTGEAYPGGNPVNVSVYAVRLGLAASYTGAVGSDQNGRLLRRALAGKGVDVSHLHTLPGRTAVTRVELCKGERVFREYDEGVLADFRLSDGDLDFLCGHDLVATGLWGRIEGELPRIKARGVPVAFDFADREQGPVLDAAAPYVDYAFFSRREDSGELRDFLRAFRQRGAQGGGGHPGGAWQPCLEWGGVYSLRRRALPCGGYHGRGGQLYCRVPGRGAAKKAAGRLHGAGRPEQQRDPAVSGGLVGPDFINHAAEPRAQEPWARGSALRVPALRRAGPEGTFWKGEKTG